MSEGILAGNEDSKIGNRTIRKGITIMLNILRYRYFLTSSFVILSLDMQITIYWILSLKTLEDKNVYEDFLNNLYKLIIIKNNFF